MFIKMAKRLKSIPTCVWVKQGAGLLTGGVAGYLYYIKIGCVSGTCPITSNPFLTILWGAVLGYLVADMFKLKNIKN